MEKFCQSCGMPLTNEVLGTNEDGSLNQDYCKYCYAEGKFTQECTMEEMIEFCVPMMKDMKPEEARKMMQEFFPHLKRWKA
ncbi:zinc ribbon domain-containing protein [Beduini massiliensis]|uniref:zinc ribbon domain-containing protein n=1 Tax=Beduini massiliensis TaxID=1585974 RepID=UPI00059A95C1|nr:zinc ribbon domain-containing protein [Beduini massiliensis]